MKKYLFLITLSYFLLGFVNILFALGALLCMTIPFLLLYKNKRKSWCQSCCPRASLFTRCGKLNPKGLKTPQFFIKGPMKWLILAYFGVSLFFIVMTTIRVSSGMIPPMYYVRFLILFPIPVDMPQLVEPDVVPWLYHLGYRFYSMMLTTTILGLIMALIYKPRTWCTVCPIATVSDLCLSSRSQNAGPARE